MGYDIKEGVVLAYEDNNKKFLRELLALLKEVNEPVWKEIMSGFDAGDLADTEPVYGSDDDRIYWEQDAWDIIHFVLNTIDAAAVGTGLYFGMNVNVGYDNNYGFFKVSDWIGHGE
jgi:hypothetical protein